VFATEYPMVRFLEANGYDVSYTTDVDTDRAGARIRQHKLFLSVGHDEYWSGNERANVEAARDTGVSLAFVRRNESFWKPPSQPSPDGTAPPYRTLVSYKESLYGHNDPDPVSWTGAWRDPAGGPPLDGDRPENSMSGQLWMVDNDNAIGHPGDPLEVPS